MDVRQHPPIDESVAELARIVFATQPLGSVLRRVAELARKAVPGADDASVTLVRQGRLRDVAFCGALAAALDERQYEARFGPALDAARSGAVITLETTADEHEYPGLARQARRHGINHVLCVGIPVVGVTTAAITIYSTGTTGPFDTRARSTATAFAEYAGVTILNAAHLTAALEETVGIHRAMASRTCIEQAKGIIMGERHCDPDEAFRVLQGMSSVANRKLRDVAQGVVDQAMRSDELA